VQVFREILEIIIELRHEFEDEEMTPFPQIVGMLVQWTNPLEVVYVVLMIGQLTH
jgi:hypothetical protein